MAWLSGLSRRIRNIAQPFTVTGRLLVLAGMFCLLGVIDPALAGLLSFVAVLAVVAFILGLCFRPRLIVKTHLPSVVIKGQPFEMTLSLQNISHLPAYDLVCTLLRVPWIQDGVGKKQFSAIGPGEKVTATFTLTATRRGQFALPAARLASLFPFALFRFFSTYSLKETLVVAPSFDRLALSDGNELGRTDTAESILRLSGQAAYEYVGSCEFRHGMSVRRWDFASWARLGQPTIREFSEQPDPIAVLIVDARRHRQDSNQDTFEAVLSRAASLVDFYENEQQEIVMFVVGNAIDRNDGRGFISQYDKHMSALATVQPGDGRAALRPAVRERALRSGHIFA